MGVSQIEPRRRAVFLDRDGVINRALVREGKPYPPVSAAALEILPGVPEALSELKAAGFLLLVVTNQPDVATGMQSRQQVEAIHARLRSMLPLDEFFVCYHQESDGCACRKPAPGLLNQAAVRFQLNLGSCFMVGDRWRDVDAGGRAGCRTAFIDYRYRERPPDYPPDVRVDSLRAAADWILRAPLAY